MNDSIKIEGYYNLLALHRTLIEAKFHENPDNYEVCDSPLVAEICRQTVEKIIEVESNKNLIKGKEWNKWLTIDCKHWIVERVLENIKNNPSNSLDIWKEFNEIDKKEKIQCMLAPFKLLKEDIYKVIKKLIMN